METTRQVDQDDALEDFEARAVTLLDTARTVYVAGSGPAVIVMHEMPGISPQVARFARWVRDAGFTVWMPSLFGRDGAVPLADEGAAVFQRVCISREFRVMAGKGTSPVVDWLRALAAQAHADCGGPGVGAVGMCLTGNFALSMMIEPALRAPILCQPSLPLDAPGEIDMTEPEAAAVSTRMAQDGLTAQLYRFEGDPFCRAERLARYVERFGDLIEARSLPDTAAGTQTSPFFAAHVPGPHSVVTQHLIDAEGALTRQAVTDMIAFLRQRLTP
ncbi:MAG: dienelactone hydrolase family protein [Pseudomonadota bacterium]